MEPTEPTWMQRVGARLERLADRPFLLLVILLALNALVRPYAGLTHDAMLYAGQTLNRAEGGYLAEDLFFRFGSQDSYSIFSLLAAPLTVVVGVHAAFFLLFLAFKVLLLWAILRWTRTLVPDRAVAALCAIWMALQALPYGGLGQLGVNETFLTPRLPAVALSLLGLESLLRGRFAASLGWIALGVLFHPIMAGMAFGVWFAYGMWTLLPSRLAAALTALGIAVHLIVMLMPSIGWALFGPMDEEWRESVYLANSLIVPQSWQITNWIAIALQALIVAAAAWLLVRGRPEVFRLMSAILLVSLGGVLFSSLAFENGYAFLVGAQPFRALWMLKLVEVPAIALLAVHAWSRERHSLALLLICTQIINGLALELILLGSFFVLFALSLRGLAREARDKGWLFRSLVGSLILAETVWGLGKLYLWIRFREVLLVQGDPVLIWAGALAAILPLPGLLIVLHQMSSGEEQSTSIASPSPVAGINWMPWIGAALALHGLAFILPHAAPLPSLQERNEDIGFVRDCVTKHAGGKARPTVYWSTYHIDQIWVDLRARSYFNTYQLSGICFQRQTAMEGRRRAHVVGAFGIEIFRRNKDVIQDHWQEKVARMFRVSFDAPSPNLNDLSRLAGESEIDFAILKEEFPGLYLASNGRLFVYDLNCVRAALRAVPQDTAVALAPSHSK